MPRRLHSPVELGIEYFYGRTYRAQYLLRIGTIGLVSLAGVYLKLFGVAVAVGWTLLFLLTEAIIWGWWQRVEPELGGLAPKAARRRQWQMIACAALSTTAASWPYFFTRPASLEATILVVLFLAGVIMLITAQQTMTQNMVLITGPPPVLALLKNLHGLATGWDAWVLVGLGLCFVVNARQLQLSNARGEARMISNQIEATQANAAKQSFLATLSHEIRTPLNGMLGMAQAMARDGLGPAQAERLDVLRRSGAALEALLNDVLDLSKIEAGKLELDVSAFDLGDVLSSAAEAFRPAAEARGLSLTVDASAAPGRYLGDPHRLRQIVTNLVSNAVKFTREGGVSVVARATPSGLEIRVADTGVGLTAAAASRVFERFTQADATTAQHYGGTGLGLAICRELAELMGGEIVLASRPGDGATFTLRLPFGRAPDAEAPDPAAREPMEAGFDGLRILVAEDNATNQLVIRHLLAAVDDAELEIVSDGQSAIEAWERARPDLILMDINMPGLDGLAATAEIRRRESQGGQRRTPILALTANAMSHQVAAYAGAGIDGVVAKPIHTDALFGAIEAALAESGASAS